MTQQQSPFLSVKYGWGYGEDNWNDGMDENLVKFSFMFDGNVDEIANTLPVSPTQGYALFNTTDNKFYYFVNSFWYNSPCPKNFIFKNKITNQFYQFDGTSAVQVNNPAQVDTRLLNLEISTNSLDSRVSDVEAMVDSLEAITDNIGTAAYKNTDYFVAAADLDSLVDPKIQQVRSDLAGAAGSGLVGFKRSDISSSVTRTVENKLSELISVKDFGAVGNALVDDTPAIQAAIDFAYNQSISPSANYRGAVIYFPPGQYLVRSTLVIRGSRISLRGAGSFHSQLVRNTDYGPTIQIQNVSSGNLTILERIEVSGMSLFHDVGGGVAMTSPHIAASAVTHGRFFDLDINNGAYGIVLYGCVDVEIKGTDVIGVNSTGANNSIAGIVLKDAAASGFNAVGVESLPTQIHLLDCEIFGPLNSGWQYGLLINAAEDVTVSNTYLGNCKVNNVLIQQDSRNKQILEVCFTDGTYIDGSGSDSVKIEGSGGNGSAYIGTVSFIGVDIKGQGGQTPGSGIFVDGTPRGGTYSQACRNLRIIGCRIGDYNNNGLWIVGCVNTIISGNQIGGNNYNNTAGGRGILLGATCDRVFISGNRVGGLPEGNGISFQTAGIEIVSGAGSLMIDGNDLRHNVNSLVDNSSLNTTSPSSKRITNNAGFNEGRSALSPTLPASTVQFYNPYGCPCWVSVFGGTVSDIKLNGQTILSSGGMFPVGTGDRVSLTYTTSPSWVWWPS